MAKFGKQYKLNGVDLRVFEHEANVHAVEGKPYQVLQDVTGVCAWVGRMSEKGQVIDSFPIFYAEEAGKVLSPELVGTFLFADLARDLAVKSRLEASWAVPHVGHLDEHCRLEYGPDVTAYLKTEFLGKELGRANAVFLNKRLARALSVNFPGLMPLLQVDARRLLLRKPHTMKLNNLDSTKRFNTLSQLATFLGSSYLQMVDAIRRRNPALLKRDFFEVTED